MKNLPKIKCANCSRTLMYAKIEKGEIEIKCPKCGGLNELDENTFKTDSEAGKLVKINISRNAPVYVGRK